MFPRLNRPKLRRSNGDSLTLFHCETTKGIGFRNVFLELLADGGACRDYQLASRSYSQRDGCRRVHARYGANHRNYFAPITAPGGYAVIAAANGKPILVE
jgi:hypothetical protein